MINFSSFVYSALSESVKIVFAGMPEGSTMAPRKLPSVTLRDITRLSYRWASVFQIVFYKRCNLSLVSLVLSAQGLFARK